MMRAIAEQADIQVVEETINRVTAENDRLRAEVATYKAAAEAAEANLESALFIFQDVRAERDRLRELLRSLRSVVMEDYRHLIDAALGGEGKDG